MLNRLPRSSAKSPSRSGLSGALVTFKRTETEVSFQTQRGPSRNSMRPTRHSTATCTRRQARLPRTRPALGRNAWSLPGSALATTVICRPRTAVWVAWRACRRSTSKFQIAIRLSCLTTVALGSCLCTMDTSRRHNTCSKQKYHRTLASRTISARGFCQVKAAILE